MTKKTAMVLLIGFFAFFTSGVVSAQESSKPAVNISETEILDYIKKIKSEVILDHKKHVIEYKVDCKECHHTYDSKKEDAPKHCMECHDFKEQKMIDRHRAPLIQTTVMKNIYHDTCNPCHEKLQRSGKPFEKKCSVCHPIRVD